MHQRVIKFRAPQGASIRIRIRTRILRPGVSFNRKLLAIKAKK